MPEDAARRVLDAAIQIAAKAPPKPGQFVTHAKVYWPDVIELRDALDEMGIDWRTK